MNNTKFEKAEYGFSETQYEMLKRCSEKKDVTEWNEWRKANPKEDILLGKANFRGFWLAGANFSKETYDSRTRKSIEDSGEVHLENANFEWADFERAYFSRAHLEQSRFWSVDGRGADFFAAHLEGADLSVAHLEECNFDDAILEKAKVYSSWLTAANFSGACLNGCRIRASVVDGATKFWQPKVDRFTDLSGTPLDNVRIDVGTKQLLEYNIRHMNWEQWYKQHKILKWPVWLFWLMSDYGLSTGRIIITFFALAIAFAFIYYVWGTIAPPGIVDYLFVDGNGVEVVWWLVPIRAIHFSVVIMTVGFTNMHANAHSFWAHILVSLQMILGFVLLGALVTRFAVLFTAGGPAGRFAEEKKEENQNEETGE